MINLDIVSNLDLAALRRRAASTAGGDWWRSLDELAETPEFAAMVGREFPTHASEWNDAVSRRRFLTLMGASLGLAGLSGCGQEPQEEIYPYVRAPEEVVPGKPLFFATALSLGGIAQGVLVESHMGRPTKIEGNPDHPASLGATDRFTQASILSLYDPDRSQVITHRGDISTWDEFLRATRGVIDSQRANDGRGIRILTESITSPTLIGQIEALLRDFPRATWHRYEAVSRENVRAGARLAFGSDVETIYHFDRAEIVVSLDADFLDCGPGSVRYQRDFVDQRRVRKASPRMNRLYAVESTPSSTGATADHRLALRAREIERFARALGGRLGIAGANEAAPAATAKSSLSARFDSAGQPLHAAWVAAVADDLEAHRGRSLVVVGENQPPVVHALAHMINARLGNVGTTVTYADPLDTSTIDQRDSLRELAVALETDQVELLLVIGGNPAYAAPVDLELARRLGKAKHSVRWGYYEDETSSVCRWHVPATHELESWGDVRAYDGTISIQQPLIAPLFGGKSASELLSALFEATPRGSYECVRATWRNRYTGDDFDTFWPTIIHNGVVPDTALAARTVEPRESDELRDLLRNERTEDADDQKKLEIIFRPDPTIWDGRFANNGWLQELPKPLTKLTWDNVAAVSAATAERLRLQNGDVVQLRYSSRRIETPIWIMPGHADESVTVTLGYGRTRAGRVGTGAGYNAYELRTLTDPWFDDGLEVVKTGKKHQLANTQHHFSMEGRDIVRTGTLDAYKLDPHSPAKGPHEHGASDHEHGGENPSLYPPHPDTGHAWGMSIDLNACTGCSACVVACQAENNSPVIGKEGVVRMREMHWLRIDTYYRGDLDNPEVLQQPMLCQHCEQAPCEVVCPVAATTHSKEGLNEMTYNRCVGTRYCSNNCPYKVR
ncbi:MAG TPA: TAT-variant-translocated molybdopterin oxidoreductase, partial [Pirellulales bacterium]|nr:TAT-variant-translocated molybdopterin oxidoreductase [Pirellulales bacterium]